ncbi:MAG TPA: chromate efflux transporter [Frateuria sp.]|uniref:chromate efflux transporter n=1 Tax=Frateuria sp. TaxID=2211372 RepID=UPI002DF65A8E|nr:chromate efflux transporter [Frateuria sp.]
MPSQPRPPGRALEVGLAFLKLGLTSFGGPIAHLGYFHREFVQRRRWLDEEHFGQLLGLCQLLPGPASSQLGFSLGLLRGGWLGGLAAFVGFTLPSALLLFVFATLSGQLAGPWGQQAIHGLKLVAVAVVAQGVTAMAQRLTPDAPRALLAAAAVVLLAISPAAWTQLLVVAGGGVAGLWLCRSVHARPGESFAVGYGRRTGRLLLLTFALLLAAALLAGPHLPALGQAAAAFYRAGSLVFGGGHVVLPLLREAVVQPGWLDDNTFLAGYGAAQAIPGPMFTLAAFLGERLHGGAGGAAGAAVGLLAIFLPGLLLVSGALPFWQAFGRRDLTARMLAGTNAAVVGLLATALYNPVWVSAVHDATDFAIALVGFVLLVAVRWPAWAVVVWCVAAAMARALV